MKARNGRVGAVVCLLALLVGAGALYGEPEEVKLREFKKTVVSQNHELVRRFVIERAVGVRIGGKQARGDAGESRAICGREPSRTRGGLGLRHRLALPRRLGLRHRPT